MVNTTMVKHTMVVPQVIPWLNDGTDAAEQRKQKFVAKKTFEQLSYLAQIYTPYTFYKCRCDSLRYTPCRSMHPLSFNAPLARSYCCPCLIHHIHRFRADNTISLASRVIDEEKEAFDFDVRHIDWVHYLKDVHVPGLRKFVLKGRS